MYICAVDNDDLCEEDGGDHCKVDGGDVCEVDNGKLATVCSRTPQLSPRYSKASHATKTFIFLAANEKVPTFPW